MDREDFIKTARAMRDARRAARIPLEEAIKNYKYSLFSTVNPWHRFLHIQRYEDGFKFYVFDGKQSLISTEHSNQNIFTRVAEKGIEKFLKRPSSRFFRRSDKNFYVQVNPETLLKGNDAIRYTIKDNTIHYHLKFDDSETEDATWELVEAEPPLPQKTLRETMAFLLAELEGHIIKADETWIRSAKITGVTVGGILTLSTLFTTCHNDGKPKRTAMVQTDAAPASPEHNL